MPYLKLNRLVLIGLLAFATLPNALASDFQYFGNEIDFWNKQESNVPKAKTAPQSQSSEKKSSEEVPGDAPNRFSWNKVMDPKNKDFFKEGDYTPPEPFMEIVRNPSDANLKMWFAYIDKKNQLSDRLQARMKEYVEKNSVKLGEGGRNYAETRTAALTRVPEDAKRFRFRMYFDSHCPHCKRMFATLAELQSKGFYVEAVQVDNDPKGLEGLPVPATRAGPKEINEKDIKSVPLLLVGDLKNKAVYRLTGYHSVASIFQTVSQGLSQPGAGMN